MIDLLGGRYTLGPHQLANLLRKKTMQSYLVCVYAILIAADAPGLFGTLSLATVMGIWAVVITTFLLGVWIGVSALAIVQDHLGKTWSTPGALVTIAALTPAIGLGETLIYVSSYGAMGFQLFPEALFYFIIAEVFALIFLRHVRPGLEQDDPPAPRQILIGAEPVDFSSLRHIEAREHHVHVTLDQTSLTQRARLSDIVAQTEPEDGLQPHRSWWVAAHAARTLKRDGARHVLQLDDGTQIPVARTRLDEVRAWMDRHTNASA
ncbi:LytTR family DNA-binding domain-containing protein [Pseudooctadecabacter sp.]|uniref:LytTR family DNA-binding domain-containing protein n=1 Tax=Pseudooctadecabacter sp. TaxID=1966338 RepID=UPI0035C8153B